MNNGSELKIRDPDLTANDDDPLCYFWGRIWKPAESEGFGFYVSISPHVEEIKEIEILDCYNPNDLQPFNPEKTYQEVKNNLQNSLTPSIKKTRSYKMFRADFEKTLSDQTYESFPEGLKDKSKQSIKQWWDSTLEDYPSHGKINYQVSTQAVSAESMIHAPEKEKREIKTPEGEKIRLNRYLRIAPELSENGTLGNNIREGEEILYRITGKSVNFVDDELMDRSFKTPQTRLFKGTLVMSIIPWSIPEEYDGEPEQYRQVFIEVKPDVTGVGYLHEDERVLTEWPVNINWFSVENVLIFSLIILGALIFVLILLLLAHYTVYTG